MPFIDNLYIERVVNPGAAFEGGGILPPPKSGVRLRSITDLRILRNEPIIGGAKLTVGWIEDNSSKDDNSYFEINIFSTQNFDLWSTQQSRNAVTDISKLAPLQTPVKTAKSPIELTVYADTTMPVTITVTLRHSSGIISLTDFTSSTTAFIKPLSGKIIRTTAASYTMSKTIPMTLLVNGSSNTTVNLPPISEVIDGFEQTVKLISASAITATLTPVASGVIENGATAVINNRYGSITYYAEKASNSWWIKSRLP